jgi:hypothetical protein
MRTRKIILLITALVLLLSNQSFDAKAASGLPDSPEFGYGAHLSTTGLHISQALAIAPELGIDWIAVNFNWARLWPNHELEPDLSTFFSVIENARQNKINILLSITNPPAWAVTPNGPDPDSTTAIALRIAAKYPDTVLVVELFPGANTATGWGTTPNPDAYIGLIQNVRNAVTNQNLHTLIIPGLSVLSGTADTANMEDLVFLQKFYEADLPTPIVGLNYPEITGQPFSEPTQSVSDVLRHYEIVRNYMLQNNHRTDLIWITGFSWPTQLVSVEEQAAWVYDAYKLLKAQLYIGAAFFNDLNPASPEEANFHSASLVLADGSLHPAGNQLKKVSSGTGESLDASMAVPQTQRGITKKHMHKTIVKRPSS